MCSLMGPLPPLAHVESPSVPGIGPMNTPVGLFDDKVSVSRVESDSTRRNCTVHVPAAHVLLSAIHVMSAFLMPS